MWSQFLFPVDMKSFCKILSAISTVQQSPVSQEKNWTQSTDLTGKGF